MEDRFRVAPLGVTAWIWTASFFAGIVVFGGLTAWEATSGAGVESLHAGATVLLIVLTIWAWVRAVRAYRIANGTIVIERAGPGRVNVPVEAVSSVQADPDLGSFFNPGFFSLGGLFGWAGRTLVRKPKDLQSIEVDLYGTNPQNAVVLEMRSGRTLVLTPADPQGFVQAVEKAGAGKAVQATRPVRQPAGKRRGR